MRRLCQCAAPHNAQAQPRLQPLAPPPEAPHRALPQLHQADAGPAIRHGRRPESFLAALKLAAARIWLDRSADWGSLGRMGTIHLRSRVMDHRSALRFSVSPSLCHERWDGCLSITYPLSCEPWRGNLSRMARNWSQPAAPSATGAKPTFIAPSSSSPLQSYAPEPPAGCVRRS